MQQARMADSGNAELHRRRREVREMMDRVEKDDIEKLMKDIEKDKKE